MTLEKFAKRAGVKLVPLSVKDTGGKIGYTDKDNPNCVVGGFMKASTAYKHWLESSFGKNMAKAVIDILAITERKRA